MKKTTLYLLLVAPLYMFAQIGLKADKLVIDKPLPKGEYAFSMKGMGMGNMDGSTTLFAFAIE